MSQIVGQVVSLWRYPVKSMMGEELNAAEVTQLGLRGDRAYALVDAASGKIGSAKNPKKWPDLFHFRAAYAEPPQPGGPTPPVRVTFPDGRVVTSTAAEIDRLLSQVFGREIFLKAGAPNSPTLEEYWPVVEGLAHLDAVTDEAMPPSTFFDCATVHVLTTATLDRLRALYPDGRFETRRFRPNIVVQVSSDEKDFVENAWVNGALAIGDSVRLHVSGSCPRCVMTTLPQGDLPQDLAILRTAVKHNDAKVGVYATVTQGGLVRRGDSVVLEAGVVAGS